MTTFFDWTAAEIFHIWINFCPLRHRKPLGLYVAMDVGAELSSSWPGLIPQKIYWRHRFRPLLKTYMIYERWVSFPAAAYFHGLLVVICFETNIKDYRRIDVIWEGRVWQDGFQILDLKHSRKIGQFYDKDWRNRPKILILGSYYRRIDGRRVWQDGVLRSIGAQPQRLPATAGPAVNTHSYTQKFNLHTFSHSFTLKFLCIFTLKQSDLNSHIYLE